MWLSTAARGGAGAVLFLSLAQPTTPLWNGVYTAAQAERGKTLYDTRCSRCHGTDLNGVRGSALAGEEFMRHWEGRSIDRLFRKIRDTMPPDGDRSVTDGDKVDGVAYLLQQNGFPEGATELAPDSALLASIQIAGRTGPTPARSGTLIQVTGCLARDAVDNWRLTTATEPQRTTLDAQTGPDRQATAAAVGGDRTVRLLNVFPSPARHEGHTMQATGFLISAVDGDRVNVVTLEMIASRCGR